MTEQTPNTPATIPEQPDAKPPLRKSMPVVIALVAILAILGIANVTSLLRGNKKTAPTSALPMRPAAPSAQQVSSFETQQQLQAQHDAEEKQRQQELIAAMQQFQNAEGAPGPESANAAPMTAAQRDAIYGGSSNAPQRTSNVSEAQAEAKQRALAREKQKQDAINSGTMAIDFAHTGEPANSSARNPQTAIVLAEHAETPSSAKSEDAAFTLAISGAQSQKSSNAAAASEQLPAANTKADPMGPYPFDQYQGRLYRIFEGTVLEGVVTNHIDGGLNGPILVMLTTDYYSHDHQQLLMPQGTRLIGTVQSVGSAQQRKMFVTCDCSDAAALELFCDGAPPAVMPSSDFAEEGDSERSASTATVCGFGDAPVAGSPVCAKSIAIVSLLMASCFCLSRARARCFASACASETFEVCCGALELPP